MKTRPDCITPPAGEANTIPTVLQVLPTLETGGVERGTVDIAAAISNAGWRALVASSGGSMVHELERTGATHIELPLHSKNPFVIRRNVSRLRSLIEHENVDILHARGGASAVEPNLRGVEVEGDRDRLQQWRQVIATSVPSPITVTPPA